MRPSPPSAHLFGAPIELTADSTNEIRGFTYATAVNTDDILNEVIILNANIEGLREDVRLLAQVISQLATGLGE